MHTFQKTHFRNPFKKSTCAPKKKLRKKESKKVSNSIQQGLRQFYALGFLAIFIELLVNVLSTYGSHWVRY